MNSPAGQAPDLSITVKTLLVFERGALAVDALRAFDRREAKATPAGGSYYLLSAFDLLL